MSAALASVSVIPAQATSGSVYATTESPGRRNSCFCPAATSAATLALVRGLVREHRRPDDIADREDVRARWCASACRPGCKPRSSTSTPAFRRRSPAVRCPPDGDQDLIETLLGRGLPAFEAHPHSIRVRVDPGDLGAEEDLLVPRLDPLFERAHDVPVAPGISWSISSTTVTLAPERLVHAGHFQADDAAADHQQPPGYRASSSAPVESMIRGSPWAGRVAVPASIRRR